MEEAPGFVQWLVGKFDDLEFYMTKSMNPDGSLAFAYYKEEAHNPTFVYIKAGLKVMKVSASRFELCHVTRSGRKTLVHMPKVANTDISCRLTSSPREGVALMLTRFMCLPGQF
jgi:hypothetical protein